jgi:hypothetical protein
MSSRSLLSSSPLQQSAMSCHRYIDDDLAPRQMRWRKSAVAAALAAPPRTAIKRGFILLRFAERFELLDLLQTAALRPKRCRCSSLMI